MGGLRRRKEEAWKLLGALGWPEDIGAPMGTPGGGGLTPAQQFVAYLTALNPLALWLADATTVYTDTALTTPAVDGNAVAGLKDLASGANHLTQAGASSLKPAYRASVAALNGKPALEFDGGDYLTKTVGGIVANLTEYHVLMVYVTSTNADMVIYGENNATSLPSVVEIRVTPGTPTRDLYFHRDAGSVSYALTTGADVDAAGGTAHVLSGYRISATSGNVKLDTGAVVNSANNPGAATVTRIGIGGRPLDIPSTFLTGHIALVLILPTVANFAAVRTRVGQEYGLTL